MVTHTIEELHELFKSGELDVKEYYKELFEEAKKQQERLNAFVTITEDEAYKAIEAPMTDDLLSHIPYVLKDNYNTKGIKTTASSKMLADYVPVFNAHVVDLLNKHGVSLVGKASMDELAMGGTNKSALTGPVHNPWDTRRISGGSSGGSAALVASGLIPFALGSDTGDSIRKPAGFCGIVGFKPTWGRISRYGVIPYASSLDHVGAFTRNVRDMAIVTEALAGRDNRDMTSSNREVPHYLENLTTDISDLKIGVLTTVSNEVRNEEVKKTFENDGVKYGDRQQGDTPDDVMINSRTDGFGDHIKRRFILGNLALATENQEKMFRKAQRVRRLVVDELNKIYENYDIIIAPNGGGVAPLIDEAAEDYLSDEYIILENWLCLANFAGTPSISIPSGFVDNMPVAVNISGRIFEEQTVLNVAYALEEALG